MIEKQILRKEMRARNRAMAPEDRQRASEELRCKIEAMEEFQKARTVALFSALPDEPDTSEALCRWSKERVVLVPRVEGEVMHFHRYDPATMRDGSFGILEPQQEEIADPKTVDLIVVPGVAFTLQGDRMGRGKGFYDKYLVQLRPDAVKVGVCYAHQLVEELPVEPHDVKLDRVLTGNH